MSENDTAAAIGPLDMSPEKKLEPLFDRVLVEPIKEEVHDLLIEGGGKDNSYHYYKHAGIGVAGARGDNEDETEPEDTKSLLP